MATPPKPLLALTASDVMSRDVVMIPQEMSLRAAAHLLWQARISGAPVVDEELRCVGVLSSTDFVHWAEGGCPASVAFASEGAVTDWEVVGVDVLPTDEVRGHMNPLPVTAAPGTPVAELARLMTDAHIHRLIVVDGTGRPVGVVSSSDILAAVARSPGGGPGGSAVPAEAVCYQPA